MNCITRKNWNKVVDMATKIAANLATVAKMRTETRGMDWTFDINIWQITDIQLFLSLSLSDMAVIDLKAFVVFNKNLFSSPV